MINKKEYIINSLKLLSLPYDMQKQYFSRYDFVDIADEVISSFENAFLYFPEVIDNGCFSYRLNCFSDRFLSFLGSLFNPFCQLHKKLIIYNWSCNFF